METFEQIIHSCLAFENTYQDMPFRSTNHVVIRHHANRKIFALIFKKNNYIWINLKTEPILGDFLKQAHRSIVPAYHMNKTHWISVVLDTSIDDHIIMDLIKNSYEPTKL